jgi:hypothetical protein
VFVAGLACIAVGLALAGVAFWAVRHFKLVDTARAAVGM